MLPKGLTQMYHQVQNAKNEIKTHMNMGLEKPPFQIRTLYTCLKFTTKHHVFIPFPPRSERKFHSKHSECPHLVPGLLTGAICMPN
jgi:hypothetical protein